MGFGFNIGQKEKKYGLILPKKKAAVEQEKKPSVAAVFKAPDDEQDGNEIDDVNAIITSADYQKQMMAKMQQSQKEALAQDSTAFLYDEVYDEITAGRKAVEKKKELDKRDRKPKYMQQLLKAADHRKHEDALYLERKYLKEAQEDADQFGDKDKFVTAAYKQKLEEERKWREEQKRLEEEEKRNDVRNKGGLTDFYRNLLRDNVSAASRGDAEEKAALEALKKEGLEGELEKGKESTDKEDVKKPQEAEKPLKGGLNVFRKPKWVKDAESDELSEEERKRLQREAERRAHVERLRQREKEAEMQLLQLKEEKKKEEEKEKEEVKRKLEESRAKRTDEQAALSARERYLQRKKQKLEEKKK